jgi:hypothetical protein
MASSDLWKIPPKLPSFLMERQCNLLAIDDLLLGPEFSFPN